MMNNRYPDGSLGNDNNQYGSAFPVNNVDVARKSNFSLSEMWRTRPVRIPSSQKSGAWLGGVAEGIGVRYQVSPLLIRFVFLALCFFSGLGILLYFGLLLVLPRYTVPLSPIEAMVKGIKDKRYSQDVNLGWVIVILVGLSVFPIGSAYSSLDWTGVVVATLVAFLLHQREPVPYKDFYAGAYAAEFAGENSGQDPATNSGQFAGQPHTDNAAGAPLQSASNPHTVNQPLNGDNEQTYVAAPGFEQHHARQVPPSWDPLGTAPFAWHLPDPDEGDATYGASAYSGEGERKRGWGTAVRILVATAVAAVALSMFAAFGFLVFIEPSDSEDPTKSTLSQTDRILNPQVSYAELDYALSTGVINFNRLDGASGVLKDAGQQKVEINAQLSDVELVIPEDTSGGSYRVVVECRTSVISDTPCTGADEYIVRGKKDSSADLPTVNVGLDSTLSSIVVTRGEHAEPVDAS